MAVLIYVGVHVFRRIKFPPDWRTRVAIVAWGVPQIGVSYAVVYWAEQHISSGMTSLLFATFPFWVAAFSARLVEGEGWSTGKFVGLVCGTAGVGVVFVDQFRIVSAPAAIAVVSVVLATLVCGFSIVCIKRFYNDQNAAALTALQMLGGAMSLTVAALVFESPFDEVWTPSSLAATVYLAVFGSALAFFGYYWLLKRVEGTVAATITFVTPVLALFWGWWVRDESVTPSLLIGGCLVLIGVRAVVRSGRKAPTRIPPRTVKHEAA